MNDLKECITSQDYVETFDQLENAGITEVRIAFSDLFEREDDGDVQFGGVDKSDTDREVNCEDYRWWEREGFKGTGQ